MITKTANRVQMQREKDAVMRKLWFRLIGTRGSDPRNKRVL